MTDSELLEASIRALRRFRDAYGVGDDASIATRVEAVRLISCLRDLVVLLVRGAQATIRLPFLEPPPRLRTIAPGAPTRRTFAAGSGTICHTSPSSAPSNGAG